MTYKVSRIGILFILLYSSGIAAGQEAGGWWPVQKAPRVIVTCKVKRTSDIREMNLAQSLSGLAAQALNEGITDEGVWIATPGSSYEVYYQSLTKRLKVREDGNFTPWQLINRYRKKQIVKGYVLYNFNANDNSINLATVYAALLKGVLIDVSQEAEARQAGLAMLGDATGRSFTMSIFDSLKQVLNPSLIVIGNPSFSNNRDYAIAHKSMVYYGVDSLFHHILEWVRPLSPVIGWNKGSEFSHIEPCTRWGLINTASDWCMNLALLSVPDKQEPRKIKAQLPAHANRYDTTGSFHAFVMSDGDNMQWAFGNFIQNNEYWSNSNNSQLPMSFTSCVLNLVQTAPDVYNTLVQTQPEGVSVTEYGGGYYYPDLFATKRANPEKWLRAWAAMLNIQMKKTGCTTLGFICRNVSGKASQSAYRIFAEEIENLTGMLAVQYNPYNGGQGATWWVKNRLGIEIPVVSAKYQLWANLPKKGSGTPDSLAAWINRDLAAAGPSSPALSWTIVHAWSYFNDPATGSDIKGVAPVKQVKDKLTPGTKVVSADELLWRIRMKHNADVTTQLLNARYK